VLGDPCVGVVLTELQCFQQVPAEYVVCYGENADGADGADFDWMQNLCLPDKNAVQACLGAP
jgi:hypothetical protein